MKNSFVAYGDSMSPLINKGDVIYVSKGEVGVGDIVLFVQSNKAIVHRIIWKRGSRVWTKGDSVFILDNEIREVDILGKVFRIEGDMKNISFFNRKVRIVQIYFLLRSIIIYIAPGRMLKVILRRLLGGRRVLVNLIGKDF